ncbi:hypothetical protein ACH4UV_38545 [Streptomyces sp. NPDC020802]|uniref:hypothetical protein n=1 Tax=Streptomyces sp. NPDC020802 TaxID=3365094 RepID=UPI0037926299
MDAGQGAVDAHHHVWDLSVRDQDIGSGWPVCRLAATYTEVVDTAGELTAGLGSAARRQVFAGALRIYGLPDHTGDAPDFRHRNRASSPPRPRNSPCA